MLCPETSQKSSGRNIARALPCDLPKPSRSRRWECGFVREIDNTSSRTWPRSITTVQRNSYLLGCEKQCGRQLPRLQCACSPKAEPTRDHTDFPGVWTTRGRHQPAATARRRLAAAGREISPRGSAVLVPPWSLARSARSEMSTVCRMALTADSQYADRIVPAAVRQWNVRSAASCLQGENCEAPCRTHASTMRSHSAKACTSFFVIMVVARRTPTPSPDSAS